jgi:adenylylsulfate kinase-like enzyme
VTGPGVVWITGLSGAGKTTVAHLVADRLAATGRRPVMVDGDRMRALLPASLGYAEPDRRKLAAYYGRLACELAGQGHLVLCATVSMFHEVREWNRANIPGYLEVWLRVPRRELAARDGRAAFYGPGAAAADVVGSGLRAEFPATADLVIDNFGVTTAADAADAIVALLGPARCGPPRCPQR